MREVYLSDLLEERRERAGVEKLPVLSVSSDQGFVAPEDIFNKTIASKDTKNYKKVLPGDFAYNPSRINIGSVALNTSDNVGIVSPMYTVFSIKNIDLLNNQYLFNFLKSPTGLSLIKHNSQGGVRFQLKYSGLSKIKIPLPDLSKQKNVVDLLNDAKFLKEKRAEIDNKLDQLIPAIFIKMFGDPATNPKNFPVMTVGELLTTCDYGTSRKSEKQVIGTPVIRMGNLSNTGVFDLSDLKYLDLSEKELARYLLYENDVLFNRTNSRELVGKTGLWDGRFDAVAASYFIRMRFDQKLEHPLHFVTYMNTPYMKRRLFEMARGAVGQSNINSQELRSIKIPVPPITLQKKFVEEVKMIESYKQCKNQASNQLNELHYALLLKSYEIDVSNEDKTKELVPSPIKIFPIQQAIGLTLKRGFERGEMVIDKVLYLVQEIYNVPLSIPFTPYKLGPWSIKVKDAVNGGMSKKSQFFKRKKIGPASVLTLSNNADKLFSQYSNARVLQDMGAALDQLLPIIKFSKSSEIECLATVCKVVQDNKTIEPKEVFAKVNKWKPAKFSVQDVNRALRIMLQQHWDKILLG